MSIVKSFVDLVLYSNLWIALCAAAMCWQTQLLLSGKFHLYPLAALIFFSTLLLYALHRLVGLSRADGFKEKGRYFVIERFRSHIGFYALLSGLATLWFAWQLSWSLWWWMLPGAVLSIGYVLPVFGNGRRLRDFHYIKIFLIAASWAWITVLIPAIELGLLYNTAMVLLFFERLFFVFAITLPFDIRDLEIDQANGVKTLPAVLGVRKTKSLALLALLGAALLGSFAFRLDCYSPGAFVGFGISLLITAWVIIRTEPQGHDYYFTGLVDGMMVLQFLCIWLGFLL